MCDLPFFGLSPHNTSWDGCRWRQCDQQDKSLHSRERQYHLEKKAVLNLGSKKIISCTNFLMLRLDTNGSCVPTLDHSRMQSRQKWCWQPMGVATGCSWKECRQMGHFSASSSSEVRSCSRAGSLAAAPCAAFLAPSSPSTHTWSQTWDMHIDLFFIIILQSASKTVSTISHTPSFTPCKHTDQTDRQTDRHRNRQTDSVWHNIKCALKIWGGWRKNIIK